MPPLTVAFQALSALSSAALLTLALPPYSQSWLAWFALAPWILAVRQSPTRKSLTVITLLFAFPYHIATLWWIGHVTVLGMVTLCAYLSCYPLLFAHLIYRPLTNLKILSSFPILKLSLTAAALWTVLEWIRSWFLTGFLWNHLATTQYLNLAFIQVVAFTGVYGPIFLLVLANFVLALTLLRLIAEAQRAQPVRPHLDFSLTFACIAVCFAIGLRELLTPEDGSGLKPIRIAAVQANIPQEVKATRDLTAEEIFEKHVRLTHLALPLKPDLILWPETSTGYTLLDLLYTRSQIFELAQQSDFLFGVLERHYPDKIYNTACLIPRGAKEINAMQIYRKNHLVMFGEYTPLAEFFPFLRNLVPYSHDLTAGEEPNLLEAVQGSLRLAPLICFEDVVPSLVRRFAALKPQILVNLTNDGWFKDSPGALQHLANSVFRCIETGLPMIRSTNTGITAIVSPRGAITHRLTDENGRDVEVEGVLTASLNIRSNPKETFYTRWGDVFVYGCLLWILLLTLKFSFSPKH
ncbi:MAG: apolipoprotein N-acyltransferase [Verrucomicrobiae bacterium]|nr:apolipoprotein N-acyltransferase [Verrucomicrobiae bacterium]